MAEGHGIRLQLAKMHAVAPQAERVWAKAGEERRPRWIAQRLLAVGPLEEHAAGGKAIDVRRQGRAAHAADVAAEVVRHDEEHAGRFGRRPAGAHHEPPPRGDHRDLKRLAWKNVKTHRRVRTPRV
jgi:hypothetical protein